MKTIFSLLLLVISSVVVSQNDSKQQLLNEISAYSKQMVMNKSYDLSYDDVWNAVYIVQSKEYPQIKRESKEKGFIEAVAEKADLKESLTIEILGKGPYRLSFAWNSQQRNQTGNTFSEWYSLGAVPDWYLHKIQYLIYIQLYGPFQWPDTLVQRINAYNATQKKDKNKILAGREF